MSERPSYFAWPKNGKEYPVVGEHKMKQVFILRVPKNDMLDFYATKSKDELNKAYSSMTNSETRELVDSVRKEEEYDTEGWLDIAVYDGKKRDKKPYDPTLKSDLSVKATLLQGSQDKLETALAEAKKRGIRFSIKETSLIEKRGLSLS